MAKISRLPPTIARTGWKSNSALHKQAAAGQLSQKLASHCLTVQCSFNQLWIQLFGLRKYGLHKSDLFFSGKKTSKYCVALAWTLWIRSHGLTCQEKERLVGPWRRRLLKQQYTIEECDLYWRRVTTWSIQCWCGEMGSLVVNQLGLSGVLGELALHCRSN